ncbi:MAG: DUF5010 domain-containing protein [Chloroflexi bacterium]|nr:DUF5010 domain-containing protein [Chloroflexota bacterium]
MRRRRAAQLLAGLFAGAARKEAAPARAQDTPPDDPTPWSHPGPYRAGAGYDGFDVVHRESFGARQRVATTYFFYWYDAAFMRASRGRTDVYRQNPTNHETMSFHDLSWFLKEFLDMQDAGLDFALPVYWGEPGQYHRRVAPAPELNLFATQGIPPMVEALETLRAVGRPFKVGMFFDTTILNDEDLTTDRGKAIFYATILGFFSRIPPHHWAAIGGRPLVWLYDAVRVKAFDQSTFDHVSARFPEDFGGLSPFIVREHQWLHARVAPPQPVIRTEGLYLWGAAVSGFNEDPIFTVAQVGPGFCNTQFAGSGPNRFCVDREDGNVYRRQLEHALRHRHQILAIETWNELGESSGIVETLEHGRLYLDITRDYVDRWRALRL